MSEQDKVRYDVVVVPADPARKVSEGIAAALLRNMAANRMVTPTVEALHKEWVEVYCAPGPAGHQPFVKGTYEEDEPPFLEAVFRWGDHPVEIEIDGGKLLSAFYLEFRGCLFKEPLGPFRKKLKDVMYLHPGVYWRLHTALPPHKEVAPEDAREEAKKLERGGAGGLAGTRVEEW